MESVLVGVDNSDVSTRAVEFAIARAKSNQWKVVLTHVIPWSPFSFTTPSENEHRHQAKEAELVAARDQIMAPMEAIAEQAGVPFESVIRHGQPADTILDIAEEHDVVHIVVGRTGDSGFRTAIFGSVASRLAHGANVPVTVVP
ncbi:MAG: universal stress protein [Actinomycetales bacterium]|nr:MAG: universal stress protein [Actinomycetales bacterium]